MAFSFTHTRYSAIAQIGLGVLSIIFGIADRVTIFTRSGSGASYTESVVPIWMGVWFVITGIIGCLGSNHSFASNGRASQPLIGTYLGFSIVSIFFAGAIIITYSIGIAYVMNGSSCRYRQEYRYYYDYDSHMRKYSVKSLEKECKTSVALGSLIIIFAILEFGIGIWASVCCCSNGYRDCCEPSVQQPVQMSQVVCIQTQHGQAAYIMTQGANGAPVAVPAVVPGTAAPQVIYPSVPAYAGAIVGGAQGVGAQGGGTQGGVTYDAQAPPMHPPAYQA